MIHATHEQPVFYSTRPEEDVFVFGRALCGYPLKWRTERGEGTSPRCILENAVHVKQWDDTRQWVNLFGKCSDCDAAITLLALQGNDKQPFSWDDD